MTKVSEPEFIEYIGDLRELIGLYATEKNSDSMSFVDYDRVERGRIVYGKNKKWYIFKN